MKRAEELGAVAPGKRVSTHTLRHSYARHLLMNGIPINYLVCCQRASDVSVWTFRGEGRVVTTWVKQHENNGLSYQADPA